MNGPAQLYPRAPARLGLTGSQCECFLAIERHIARFGHSPTSRELAKVMGRRSFGGIHVLLEALQERGWITFLPNRARSIAIVPEAGTGNYKLPPDVEAKLLAHCCATNEDPADVLADAVTLFLDEAEGSVAA